MVKVATPPDIELVPNGAVPSRNVTVPDGAPPAELIVAVNVSVFSATPGLPLDAMARFEVA